MRRSPGAWVEWRRAGAQILGVILLLAALWCCWLMPAGAAPFGDDASKRQPDRQLLTLELLQERLRSPLDRDGLKVLDLRQLTIDLRPENAEFREQFYRRLQAQLQRSGSSPLGLDLSYSLVQGEFRISQLGLRVPRYGQALSPLLTPEEQTQLQRDRRRLSQLQQLSQSLLFENSLGTTPPAQISVFRGPLNLTQARFSGFANFSNTFFLDRVEAQGATFGQDVDWSEARFSQLSNFASVSFQQASRFRNTIFFDRARFNQARFQGPVSFQGSEFQETANFNQALFERSANFSRIQWQQNADLAQTQWLDQVQFNKSRFLESCFFNEAIFEKFATFREVLFRRPVNLRGATILDQVDFSDAAFAQGAYLNLAGLKFDADEAKILGDPGRIGQLLSVPSLQGNETVLRNLVRNFRRLEQIPDANQVEYTTERLRLRELGQRLLGLNLNIATPEQLQDLGLSAAQAAAIARRREQQLFRNSTELLGVEGIDLATYVKLRDQVVAGEPLSWGSWLLQALNWLGLSLLLLLSQYGTNFWLVFGTGLLAIAYFSLLFWLVDRVRRWGQPPVRPTWDEVAWTLGSVLVQALAGLLAIFRTASDPWLTLLSLAIIAVPLPVVLLAWLYGLGRCHDLSQVSYFVEDGSLRQLRLLIGRLPVMPRYGFFRDRYMPLLWDRRWNWLNYYDFSLNNLLKFGFNDIRLRDEQMPGPISTLAWYQWSLGLLYISLLLWTLSRTIPGLNLLIYFK